MTYGEYIKKSITETELKKVGFHIPCTIKYLVREVTKVVAQVKPPPGMYVSAQQLENKLNSDKIFAKYFKFEYVKEWIE